jgi:crotonobetainyl-CoA:carnitine CoA-transferase CaiB-like acyl-CoA transferase
MTEELATSLGGDMTVVDLSIGIAGGYCGKLLADGGANVIKIEDPQGDPLRRRWLLGDAPSDPSQMAPLFRHLAASTASVVIDPASEGDLALLMDMIRSADAVMWTPGSALAALPRLAPEAIRQLAPRAVVTAMTHFGLVGEPAYAANEFTLQAMGAGSFGRGRADREPLAVGGAYGDWITGLFGAVGLLTAHQRGRETGRGELVDVSALDCLHLTQTMFTPTFFAASGRPMRTTRVRTIPLIHPTSDGFVGFQITTGQQWQDFCAMVDKPDWAADPTLTRFDARIARFEEVNGTVDAWTRERSTDEIVELSVHFRLPVAPVTNGSTIQRCEQVTARGWYIERDDGLVQPEAHYTFYGSASRRPFGNAPVLGRDTERVRQSPLEPKAEVPTGLDKPLPFSDLRIADFTAFWAGPIIGHYFAMFGADVIHVESTQRPDGIRAATLRFDMSDQWWEASPTFAATNTNKRGITLDMRSDRGRELARRLVAESDILIENFSSRVLPQWGLDYESLKAINPRLIMVRAPGFGINGPWADRVAYATTIEQASGAAYVTGYADDRPDVAGGSMDPVAGTHAVFAILLALEHRRRTGEGMLVEVPQFTSGMNVCAEQVLTYSATGRLLERIGNRSWTVAPQGAYRVLDVERTVAGMPPDEWVAISIETDEQWLSLCRVIAAHDLAARADLRTVEGRRAHHDAIDDVIGAWSRTRATDEVISRLRPVGIPVAAFIQTYEMVELSEVKARNLYEDVDNPVLGTVPIVGYPVRFERGPLRMHGRRAPLLGEHNREVLVDLLGVPPDEFEALESDGIIGTKAATATAW